MAGASIETTLELWASSLRDVKQRMRPLFSQDRVATSAGQFLDGLLVLLRHKFLYFARFLIGAVQHGHRGKLLTRARTSRRRMVAMEFGMCRSGRSGRTSGSVTFGNGRGLEHRGGTRC